MNVSTFFIDKLSRTDSNLVLTGKKDFETPSIFANLIKVSEENNSLTEQVAETNAQNTPEVFNSEENVINLNKEDFLSICNLVAQLVNQESTLKPTKSEYKFEDADITKEQFVVAEDVLVNLISQFTEKSDLQLFSGKQKAEDNLKSVSISFKNGLNKLSISFNPLDLDKNTTNQLDSEDFFFVNKILADEFLNANSELPLGKAMVQAATQQNLAEVYESTDSQQESGTNYFKTEIIKIIDHQDVNNSVDSIKNNFIAYSLQPSSDNLSGFVSFETLANENKIDNIYSQKPAENNYSLGNYNVSNINAATVITSQTEQSKEQTGILNWSNLLNDLTEEEKSVFKSLTLGNELKENKYEKSGLAATGVENQGSLNTESKINTPSSVVFTAESNENSSAWSETNFKSANEKPFDNTLNNSSLAKNPFSVNIKDGNKLEEPLVKLTSENALGNSKISQDVEGISVKSIGSEKKADNISSKVKTYTVGTDTSEEVNELNIKSINYEKKTDTVSSKVKTNVVSTINSEEVNEPNVKSTASEKTANISFESKTKAQNATSKIDNSEQEKNSLFATSKKQIKETKNVITNVEEDVAAAKTTTPTTLKNIKQTIKADTNTSALTELKDNNIIKDNSSSDVKELSQVKLDANSLVENTSTQNDSKDSKTVNPKQVLETSTESDLPETLIANNKEKVVIKIASSQNIKSIKISSTDEELNLNKKVDKNISSKTEAGDEEVKNNIAKNTKVEISEELKEHVRSLFSSKESESNKNSVKQESEDKNHKATINEITNEVKSGTSTTEQNLGDGKSNTKSHNADLSKDSGLNINVNSNFETEKVKSFNDVKQMFETAKAIKQEEIIPEFSKAIQQGEKQSLTFQLTPENLGKVKLVVDLVENSVTTKIEVENEQVKQFIQSNIEQLKTNLQSSGIQLNSINISLADYSQKQNGKVFTDKKKNNSQSIKEEAIEELNIEQPQKKMGYNTYEYLA